MTASLDIRGRRITVIGAARSGMAAARLAAHHGARVLLSEQARRDAVTGVTELEAQGVTCEFGGHSEAVYASDLFVVSPGVPSDAPVLIQAASRGIPIIGELEFGSRFCHLPVIAVTGTNGKTTTTSLTGALFTAAGMDAVVAGNIGVALCDAVLASRCDADALVLEVSSYQLDLCDSFHPRVAMLTTITPDHLGRYHGDFERYLASKQRVFMNQTEDDALIYNLDSFDTVRAARPARARAFPASVMHIPQYGGWMENRRLLLDIGEGRELVAAIDDVHLRGRHNYRNILMAAIAARLMGVPLDAVRDGVRRFEGVEHRLEFVRRLGDVSWINDSKSTNVDSLIIALQSMQQPVILIAGGRDKGAPYDPVLDLVREKVRVAVLIGEATPVIEQAFEGVTHVVRASSMPDAVSRAHELARPGECVLLSPACASFDMFENFEHRGLVFKKLVHALTTEGEA